MIKTQLLKIKYLNNLFKRYVFIRQVSFPLFFVNFLFQRVFRLGSGLKYSKHFTTTVVLPENFYVENDSEAVLKSLAVSGGCYLQASMGIYIGEGTIWSANVTIVSLGHDVYDYNKAKKDKPIRIGKNCWLGAGSVILPGVTLGDHTVVGSNSVVTKSFPEGNIVIAGAPAIKIKDL